MIAMTKLSVILQAMQTLSHRAEAKSRAIVKGLVPFVERALPWWIVIWSLLAVTKMATSLTPIHSFGEFASLFLPYALIAAAPIAALRIGNGIVARGWHLHRPRMSLAFVGRWQPLDPAAARAHPLYGPHGFMASLMVGMLLNVVLRSGEFLMAVPAMSDLAPGWGRTLFLAMAFECMAMNFLYIACFVMALRTAPLFPRLLALTWGIDMALQLGVAKVVSAQAALPLQVADALSELLQGNITKVMISVIVWMPYLLLSPRVNLTYRHRLAA